MAVTLVWMCLVASLPTDGRVLTVADGSSGSRESELQRVAQAVLDMQEFDEVFSSELLAERSPFAVVGLSSDLGLTKRGRTLPILSLQEVRERGLGYVVFEETGITGSRARVVLANPDKDLFLDIDVRKKGGVWRVKSYRMEQRWVESAHLIVGKVPLYEAVGRRRKRTRAVRCSMSSMFA